MDCKDVSFDNETRLLHVHWPDGHTSAFPYIWLRHYLFHPATGRPEQEPDADCLIIEPPEISVLASAELDGGALVLNWQHDGRQTRHQLAELRRACLSETARAKRRRLPKPWSRAEADSFRWFPAEAMQDPAQRFEIFLHLRDCGIVLLEGLGDAPGTLPQIAPWFGPIRRTHFGELFDVRSKPADQTGAGEGIGATAANAQAPHIDEDYRDNVPGISFFHCLKPDAAGRGASLYIDGVAAAERLRKRDPQSFDILTRIPVLSAATRNAQERFRSRTRTITVDDDGVVRGVSMSDRVLPPLDLPIDLIEPVYRALGSFQREVYDYSHAFEAVLQPGQCAIFDNHRVLHTRRSFDKSAGERWLQQLSVDRDEFNNSLQCLALELGHTDEAEVEQDSGLLTQIRLPLPEDIT
ncbi:hypothetical protein RA19_24095 [Leisingera sp. ANG-M1]|uniref:TauD/TfdA family dioxygenase n=1 Tax=Leisingera sp. ANG-M1 TaxID=1577895 RepID=UPI0005807EF6|nr:TauD/TfdA family dioxygenase [Leisingera sp. ANG-M1]KIC07398.1 hypothetical protein RA19_24095 [Leisingera sp. ANG-M1]